ncbi:MAG: DtxR family Mn-dependent transcriptional regulator [Maribacter sp.]|jgi:DtxR family Mn-dependent transcriptional regulator
MPTQTKENYLKAIFSISQKSDTISMTELADMMQVSKSTANSMVKKMKENDWLVYEKYKPLKLTSKGRKLAALIVRKHRLAEMFLSKIMDFGWEEVHDIAEEMEHLKSTKLFDRIDEILGFPTQDPHGSPIPDRTGKITRPDYLNLTTLNKGEKVRLAGLTNSSKELLIFLNKKNIRLGTILIVKDIEEFDKTFEILLNDSQPIMLTYNVCQCLLVEQI